ncbi:MAG: hypothetical protein A2Y62_11480 [Candidatus Fischerbacteria bacterium RBG_13_37_8]|uniref:Uncharacterized protein n=1 Tax=Candidatus Fischerbacteria bacterium RBG_13_37_8 TaxID=1817863 RepID=A0A1F5VXY7_9BACT|nr:MAG: hypothetical protein A2Y62_11480 [Candidatus Fischerbacteria bacterium RBG_13_37_8]
MDNVSIKENAAKWMMERNWKRLTAKKREFEQSLFEHTMVELDAMMQILEILRKPQHFRFSQDEEQILIASIIAHDVGKEKKEWQDYILGKKGFVSDIDPELTKRIISPLCNSLGFIGIEGKIIKVIENCINLHMKHERSDSKVMAAIIAGADRWKTLANIVDIVDNICSASGIFAALSSMERSFLANHLKIAYHHVNIRGVSTIFLHKAATDCSISKGWDPLLFYGNGTIYVCSAGDNIEVPTVEEIKEKLSNILKEDIGNDIANLIVGSPLQNILPKPDLFDYKEVQQYLVLASKKIGKKNYWNKKGELTEKGKKVGESYVKLKGLSSNTNTSDIHIRRIADAHPEMVIFKFFKAIMSQKLIGVKGQEMAKSEYEKIFGKDSWEKLQSTSTLMPSQDMIKTVDYFWSLPGKSFALNVETVEEVSDNKRKEILIDILNKIAKKVYDSIPEPPSRSKLSMEMAESFMKDLIKPSKEVNIQEIIKEQLEIYSTSKSFAGKESKKSKYFCPLCNTPFKKGVTASADFIDNPQSHTNRGISHGKFDYVIICNTCKYERFLRQIIIEGKPSEFIIIFPRMNIGYSSGNILVQKVKEFYERAYNLMVGNNDNPSSQISLSLTQLIAKKVLNLDIFTLSPRDLIEILTYQGASETQKKQRKELEKQIKEKIGQTFNELNDEWGTDFNTWDEAVDAMIAGRIIDPIAIEIRKEVFRLIPQLKVVCQTSNVILIPIINPIAMRDESEANSAIRKIFISLLIGLSFDVTIAIVGNMDEIDFEGGEGIAYVPPVPAIRKLIGHEWIALSEAMVWLKAIGAASLLANDTGYPERSNLFSILSAQSPGHILKRLEEKHKHAKPDHINYIEIIKEVLL